MNLALVFALASAAFWGSGDFLGGLASRTGSSISTTFIAQGAGLVGLVAVCAVAGPNPFVDPINHVDVRWGVAAGLSAVVGIGLFYEAMARGPLGPVASVTSVVSSLVPVAAGVMLGERPNAVVFCGVFFAVLGIWLVAGQRRNEGERAATTSTLLLAAMAGVFFAGYLIALSQTSGEAGLWPVAAGRAAATLAIGLVFLGTRIEQRTTPGSAKPSVALGLAVGAGLFDATANALYAVAAQKGLLSVVAVVASLYPASTVLLARLFLAEKLTRRRGAGMAVGFGAVGAIAFASSVSVIVPSGPVSFDDPISLEVPALTDIPTGPPSQLPLVDFDPGPAERLDAVTFE
jgi:drug/metabolite transporter (DMT)-like permease